MCRKHWLSVSPPARAEVTLAWDDIGHTLQGASRGELARYLNAIDRAVAEAKP